MAMCFVRKGLDKVFTYNELKWLDDILPGTCKPQRTTDILTKTVNEEPLTKRRNTDEENNALIATNGTLPDSADTSTV